MFLSEEESEEEIQYFKKGKRPSNNRPKPQQRPQVGNGGNLK
jgi:hypothetical protein